MQLKFLRRIYTLLIMLGLNLALIQPAAGSTALPKPGSVEPAVIASVSGVVTDGGVPGFGAHGYPLYARIYITAPGFEETIFTDPITGAYSINLEEGTEYTFTIEAFVPGYLSLTQTLTPSSPNVSQDFTLLVDPVACATPGYQQDYDIFYDFEDSNHGFTADGSTSFAWGEFTSGPLAGHSGSKGIATNLSGNYSPNESGAIVSPLIDLSGNGDDPTIIQWWDWKDIENVTYDSARLDVSDDGGVNWTTLWGPVGGIHDSEYHQQTIVLDPLFNVDNFRIRFYFESDTDSEYQGWYIDDIGILSVPLTSTIVFSTNFDTDNGSFTSSGTNASWAWGDPSSGPGAAHSSPNVWGTNIDINTNDGKYNNLESSFLTSQPIDLSSYPGQTPILSFYQWNDIENITYDWGSVEVTKDGGSTWQDVSGKIGDVSIWSPKTITLDPAYAVSNLQFRFRFQSDSSINFAGWYIDDVALSMAEPVLLSARCIPSVGGAVAGYVFDENTGLPLVGSEVSSPSGGTQTVQWGNDSTHAGFYWTFQPTVSDPEAVDFTASNALYSNQVETINVAQHALNPQNFSLSAGSLAFDTSSFTIPMTIGDPTEEHNLTLTNNGNKEVYFTLNAEDVGYELLMDGQPSDEASGMDFLSYEEPQWDLSKVKLPPLFLIESREAEIQWLSLTPTIGTVSPLSSNNVKITLDPTSLSQPGDYKAEIIVDHDTPYTYEKIPVTLQLGIPPDWGTVKGNAAGLEQCDINPTPMAGANISFWQGNSLVGSIQTTETGYYSYSLPGGTYDIIVSKEGYLDISLSDFVLNAGTSIIQDFSLRLLVPCISVNPTSLEQTLTIGDTATQVLTLINTGAGEAAFELLEAGANRDAMILYESFEYEGWLPADWDTSHKGLTSHRWTTENDPEYVYEGHYAAWIRYDDFLISDEWLITPVIDASLLTDLQLSFMAFSDTNYPGATMKLWVTDESGTPLTTDPIWDLIRDENWSALGYRQISKYLTNFNRYGPIRLAWQYVGLNGQSFGLDLVQLTGNVDVTWLNREPNSGVIYPDGGEFEISIGFDAYDLEPGDYDANLSLNSAPDPLINVPVSLHVELSSSPYVYDIPDQSIVLGESFATIALDNYVVDGDHTDDQINWTVTGNTDLVVTIDDNRIATITYPTDWTGSETLTFTAADPDGYSGADTATFTVVDDGNDFQVFLPVILK